MHACSQRELARTALSRTEHESAADHFTLALSRNPLDAESWFGLGFCELKRGPDRAGHAAVAFTRCVQADGSHGEAWNNLGALHVAAARYGPALKALTVAIKLCGRSWQVCWFHILPCTILYLIVRWLSIPRCRHLRILGSTDLPEAQCDGAVVPIE